MGLCHCGRICRRDTESSADYEGYKRRNIKQSYYSPFHSNSPPPLETDIEKYSGQMDAKTIELLNRAVMIPDSTTIIMHSVSEEESAIHTDNERIESIMDANDIMELEKRISNVYASDRDSDDHELDEPDEEEEKMEQIIKDEKVTKVTGFRAYRMDTGTEWDQDEMEDLEYQYKQELMQLTKHSSYNEMQDLHDNNQLSQIYEITTTPGLLGDDLEDEDLPESNLYRDASKAKWSSPAIEKQKQEMTKQMLYLASQNVTKQ